MPFQSVAGLKKSETYLKSKTLQKMPAHRLARFVEVYDNIFAKKKAAGASDEVADATAFSLAYASAERFQATPKGATLEAESHWATTMAPIQFSQGGEVEDNSFDFLLANLDIINAAVAGNALNLNHLRHEPLGVIHRIVPASQVPAAHRANLAKDAPFAVEFSYFNDTPEQLKAIKTISAEWLKLDRQDGRSEVMLPDSFAVTEEPATTPDLGVAIISTASTSAPTITMNGTRFDWTGTAWAPTASADGEVAKDYLRASASVELENTPMADKPDTSTPPAGDGGLVAKMTALTASLEAEKTAHAASDSKLAALRGEYDVAKAQLASLVEASETREANDAAAALVGAKKATTDRQAYFAGLYRKLGKAAFAELADAMPVIHIGVSESQAVASLIPGGDAEAEAKFKAGVAKLMKEA